MTSIEVQLKIACQSSRAKALRTFTKELRELGAAAHRDYLKQKKGSLSAPTSCAGDQHPNRPPFRAFEEHAGRFKQAVARRVRDACQDYCSAFARSDLVLDANDVPDLIRKRLRVDLISILTGPGYRIFHESAYNGPPSEAALASLRNLARLGNRSELVVDDGNVSWRLEEAIADELNCGESKNILRRWEDHRRLMQEQRDAFKERADRAWKSEMAQGRRSHNKPGRPPEPEQDVALKCELATRYHNDWKTVAAKFQEKTDKPVTPGSCRKTVERAKSGQN